MIFFSDTTGASLLKIAIIVTHMFSDFDYLFSGDQAETRYSEKAVKLRGRELDIPPR